MAGAAGPAAAGPLGDLIDEALRSHPAAQAQQARAGAAQAEVEGARWQFWPTPYANVDLAGAGQRGDRSVTSLGVRQPLWTGGRLTAQLDRSRAGADAAQAQQEQTRLQLAMRMVQGYGEWRAAQLKLQALSRGIAVHERMVAQVTRRMQEGQASQSDQTLAQGRLASLQADQAATQTQLRVALARLSQLAGRNVDGAALARQPEPPQPWEAALPALLDRVQATSPLLAQYRALAQAEAATLAQRKAELLPELQLRVERQQGNLNVPGVGGANVVALGLSTNFGPGLSNRAAIEAAASRHAAALADLQAQSRDVSEQVMTDHATLEQAAARRQALRAAIESADQVRDSWDRQYLAGRKTWQDLLGSAREKVQVETQWADLEAAQLVASWRLHLLANGVAAAVEAARGGEGAR